MENRVWLELCRLVAQLPVPPRIAAAEARCVYPVRTIVLVAVLAALKDRPDRWALDARNWPAGTPAPPLPCPGQYSRRASRPSVRRLIQGLFEQAGDLLGPPGGAEGTAAVDGKGLLVARHSGDPDARLGRLYELCYGRPPAADELAADRDFLGQSPTAEAWTRLAHSLLIGGEFLFRF